MKAFYKYSILAGAILLAACQPKSEPKESQDKPADPTVVQQSAESILRGETMKLQVRLPECKGNTCPDFTVERLQSNFPFIDQLLDQQRTQLLTTVWFLLLMLLCFLGLLGWHVTSSVITSEDFDTFSNRLFRTPRAVSTLSSDQSCSTSTQTP